LVSKATGTQFGQVPAFSELTGLKIRHDAFLNTIKTDLFDGGDGQLIDLMDVHQLGRDIRRQVDRKCTVDSYRTVLASDRVRPHGK
ncbi:hypothetical protein Q6248_28565, partial [Klebsiella pneumoniae]|uniref:hypothetical protein n=1 Tax=Klebsiella pneumoniae TaxID=573 RepID=UPI00272FF73D